MLAFLLLFTALAGADLDARISSARCSIDPYPSARSVHLAYFVATARADTVHVGPGSLVYYPRDLRRSEPLSAPTHPVFGQVVRIDQYGGVMADEVQRVLSRSGGDAVVVPWNDRGDCRRMLWDGSAQWVTPSTEGFFVADLRPMEEWVGGRPTFDVGRAWDEPYSIAKAQESRAAEGLQVLTPAEYFSLYAALPLWDWKSQRDISPGTWQQWEAAHPDLAVRYPAVKVLRRVRGIYP